MFTRTGKWLFVVAAAASLLLACSIEEDLRIHGDGSGVYRVRVSIPKALGEDFDKLRKEAGKTGFRIVQEGETDDERFVVLVKDFTDVSSVSDSNSRFELTMTKSGFLRREYRLRATLEAVGFGSFKRRFIVTMPGKIQSATAGEITGSQVRWEGSTGVSMEVVSSAFALSLSPNQKTAAMIVIIAALVMLVALRRRRRIAPAMCLACNSPLRKDARFCGICGADIPVAHA